VVFAGWHCAAFLCCLLRCICPRARVQLYSRSFLEHCSKGFARVLFVFSSCFVRNPGSETGAVPEAGTKQTRSRHEGNTKKLLPFYAWRVYRFPWKFSKFYKSKSRKNSATILQLQVPVKRHGKTGVKTRGKNAGNHRCTKYLLCLCL
jgi:hypothetical protein